MTSVSNSSCDPASTANGFVVPSVKQLKSFAFDLHETVRNASCAADGFGKLKRKVLKELQHLQTLDDNATYSSSNIYNLNSVWQTLLDEGTNVCALFKKFKYFVVEPTAPVVHAHAGAQTKPQLSPKKSDVVVDIVCDNGLRWIKVKTSNPYSMQLQFLNSGASSKGKNIVSMAENMLSAARQHCVYLQPPKIEMLFACGITCDLAYILRQKHIMVKGAEIKQDFLCDETMEDEQEEGNGGLGDSSEDTQDSQGTQGSLPSSRDMLDESGMNLGVRSMLTMISSLSHDEIDEEFFSELQDSLFEKQLNIVSAMFSQQNIDDDDNDDDDGGDDDGDESKKDGIGQEASPMAVARKNVVNLDFEYCDYPNVDVTLDPDGFSAQQLYDNGRLRFNAAGNQFTTKGYTVGHSQKLTLSETARRKKFSDKSYEEQKMLLQLYLDQKQGAVLPEITKCMADKKLICCEAAWNHFMDIVNLSAGPTELKRCRELQAKISIVANQISPRTQALKGKAMSDINKCVFGTGDSLKVITCTGVANFPRKAEKQGVDYFVHIHPVRPLTERYQIEYQRKKGANGHIIKPNNGTQQPHIAGMETVHNGAHIAQPSQNGNGIVITKDEDEDAANERNIFFID